MPKKIPAVFAFFLAAALCVPPFPAAAYDEICIRNTGGFIARMHLDALDSQATREHSRNRVQDGVFAYEPVVANTIRTGNFLAGKTACLNPGDLGLRDGDLFRVRVQAIAGRYAACTHHPSRELNSGSFWPGAFVQDDGGGRITFHAHNSSLNPICKMESGERMWDGCDDDEFAMVLPGCWQWGPKVADSRLVDFVRPNKPPAYLRFLLTAGGRANVNLPLGANNQTPLLLASQLENTDYLRMLLFFNADPGAADNRGVTPLHWTAQYNRPEQMELLLNYGADRLTELADARESRGLTPLHLAIAHNHRDMDDIVGMLLSVGSDFDSPRSDNGDTPLHTLAKTDRPRVMLALVASGADMNARHSETGETPLDVATRLGTLKAAAVLIASGAERNITAETDNPADAQNEGGTTQLHTAASRNDFERVRVLLELQADPNIRDGRGITPALLAIRHNHSDNLPLVTALADAGADLEIADNDGRTCAWWAAHVGRVDVLELLESRGADLSTPDTAGVSPLQIAEENGREEAAQFLRERL